MKDTQERVYEHFIEAKQFFKDSRIVGIFLQGSQNYGLEVENSDVDTKLIVVPTLDDICFNKKPYSTTYVRANEEHIDFKDLRLMLQTFRKQNLNFVEILFTEYYMANDDYWGEWNRLVEAREKVAHYNPYQAVKTMKGIAMEKYHAMEHPYPSKLEILAKYGYDPKQLHHLLRVEEFLNRYMDGEPYEDCLRPRDPEHLKDVKRGCYNLTQARALGLVTIRKVTEKADEFCEVTPNVADLEIDELLDDVQRNIMRAAIRMELEQ